MKHQTLLVLFILSTCFVFGQKEIYYQEYNYNSLKEGTYEQKSFSLDYLKKDLPIIKSNIESINTKDYSNFLNPYNREIVLFKNHKLDNLKPVGKITGLTQVYWDSVIYKYKFKDLTNCVWNRIRINEKFYYTDADIHDYTITESLDELNQTIKIIGQYKGYDGAYHLGYPEYFFMIFTDNENRIIHITKVLDFNLNDEFAMKEDILAINWNENNNSYEINLIGEEEKIMVRWNGKVSEIIKK